MCADFIKINDPPPTIGGEYEQEVRETLFKKLSNNFLVIGGASFPTKSSYFYDFDIILMAPFLCDVLEVKRIYPRVKVFEDWLESGSDFRVPRVFSSLENKTRVLAEKLRSGPFFWKEAPWVNCRVLIGPKETEIKFDHKEHQINKKVLGLEEAIQYYKKLERENSNSIKATNDWQRFKQSWIRYSQNLSGNRRNKLELGRFIIRKRLPPEDNLPEYLGTDELPCKVDVHLKEFPFESVGSISELESYLKEITREMQILRRLRHQYIRCVVGHFRTGCSLVQVSDWFEGITLENAWRWLKRLSLNDKLGIMVKIVQGMAFCHSKGVFHRNINASSILINEDFDDIRIVGFEFAKDLELTKSITKRKMELRNRRIIPPEELLKKGASNYRLYDIYQTGLLFYRIIEDGEWPFEDVFDFVTEKCFNREFSSHRDEKGFREIRNLILSMMQIKPQQRPDPMLKVEGILNNIITKNN
jgi:serine/threonine protein kinase